MNYQNLQVGDICIVVTSDPKIEINNLGRCVTLEKFVPAGAGHLEFNGVKYQCISEDGWIVSGDDLWCWSMRDGYHKSAHTGVYARRLRKIGDKDCSNIKSTGREVTA
jgi:hypothetical protein